jgi:OsmC-like protein
VTPVDGRGLQRPLKERYAEDPDAAQIVIRVSSVPSDLGDPLHCAATPEVAQDIVWRSGAHEAVGGSGDVPCSADLLLGAPAACQEVTLRMVAANMGVELESLIVTAEADWDAMGTLAMGGDAPVGLKAVRCHTNVVVKDDGKGDRTRASAAQRREVLPGAQHVALRGSRGRYIRVVPGRTMNEPSRGGR